MSETKLRFVARPESRQYGARQYWAPILLATIKSGKAVAYELNGRQSSTVREAVSRCARQIKVKAHVYRGDTATTLLIWATKP